MIETYYTDLLMAYYDKEVNVWWRKERVSETKKYSVNALIYANFKLDIKK